MAHHESAARGPDARMVDRMLFFSDAVFAIVLTLLALELRAPEVHEGVSLWSALAAMAKHFTSFAISFALVALWWTIHMRITRSFTVFDWPAARANLLVLGCVTLIPFASSVFGEDINSLERLQVYWWISAAVAFSMSLFYVVSTRDGGRLVGGMSAGEWWARFIQSLAPGIAFVAGIYFCATGQTWLARFAAFIMFPIMIVGSLFWRKPKSA